MMSRSIGNSDFKLVTHFICVTMCRKCSNS